MPFVIAHDEQPYRLREQEERGMGVPPTGVSSPSLLHAPATNDQGLRPDEPGVGENRVCVGHQPEGLAVRSRGSSESSSATPGQHAHGTPDPEGVNVPFVIAHDEQPYRLLEQEEERYGGAR